MCGFPSLMLWLNPLYLVYCTSPTICCTLPTTVRKRHHFRFEAKLQSALSRLNSGGMSKTAASLCVRPATDPGGENPPGEALVRAFADLRDELVSTLCFLLGNQEDAQDMAQETFLRCWRAQEGLPEIKNLRAWVFRIGLNAAKDLQRSAWKRRSKPLQGVELMPATTAADPGEALDKRECVQRIRQALAELRPEEKEVFLLRQNGDLTYEQIAEISDRPIGTVKTQMRNALHKLRKVLTEN